MGKNTLHPEVQRFKKYMSEQPKLKRMVRERKKTLQQLFEEWYEVGEVVDEEGQERETEVASSWSEKIVETIASLDANKWNSYVAECQSILETIQLILADLVDQRKGKSDPLWPSKRRDLD
ncbi:spore coat protein YlbD [Bacillus sp. Hm123]|uniref:spore coat protein YlbD n=1 Tax=Bacillus sp. Hm123 TaxID=3450745 RepID=UPI003F444917